MSDAWVGLIGVVFGIFLTQVTTWLNRKWDLKEEREERWKAFQRESTLEAQDQLGRVYQGYAQLSPDWLYHSGPLEDDTLVVDEIRGMNAAKVRSWTLRARIKDEQLRSILMDFHNIADRYQDADRDQAGTLLSQMQQTLWRFHERAETILLELY